jgi:hypothetical protein
MGYLSAFMIILIGVLAIATAAIGVDCMNRNPEYESEGLKESNKGYLYIALGLASLTVFLGFYDWFTTFTKSSSSFIRR